MMEIKCRICGKIWSCSKDQCNVRDRNIMICELCLQCFASKLDSPEERVRLKNPFCYSEDINPSKRDDS